MIVKLNRYTLLFVFCSCQFISKNASNIELKKSILCDSQYFKKDSISTNESLYLGNLIIENNIYSAFNYFRKIKTASSYHGQSFILFISKKDTIVYILNSKEDFPNKVKKNNIYFDNDSTNIVKFSNLICLRSCFEKVNNFEELEIFNDSINFGRREW